MRATHAADAAAAAAAGSFCGGRFCGGGTAGPACAEAAEEARALAGAGACSAPVFGLQGVRQWARLLDAYDGDTVWVAMRLAGHVLRVKLRLQGVDTPEVTSRVPEHRAAAHAARDALVRHLLGPDAAAAALGAAGELPAQPAAVRAALARGAHLIWVECGGCDKYGRVLAVVRPGGPGGRSAAEHLIAAGLGAAYHGGTRAADCAKPF